MSDQRGDDYLMMPISRKGQISAMVTAQMLKGAAWAAGFCLVVLVAAWVLLGVSALLPEESKEGWDPNAFLATPPPATQVA